jgi:CheY-like chemotaxis protein
MYTAIQERNGLNGTLARVLVASPDQPQLRELSGRLGACGYATLAAEPGTAALRLVRDARPDVVLAEADG